MDLLGGALGATLLAATAIGAGVDSPLPMAESGAMGEAVEAPTFVTTTDVDMLWNIVAGIFILLMQLGFSLLEAGSIRRNSVGNIFFKNLMDIAIGAIAWFCIGYALSGLFADGENAFIGGFSEDSLGAWANVEHGKFAIWFFQFTFCATAATIVSGSLAERTNLEAYMFFVLVMSAFVYPVVVHWAWDGDGFLFKLGYADFAGSGVVHMVGGITGLVGAIFVGPRRGRFRSGFLNACLGHDLEHDRDDEEENNPHEANTQGSWDGHSVPFQVMGTIVLFVGWLAFNAGSTGAVHDSMDNAALCAVNTVLAAAGGAASAVLVGRLTLGYYSIPQASNGLLAGLVAITAGCNAVMPAFALLIGALGGLVYLGTSIALVKLEIDDPLDAFPVHGAAGLFGILVLAVTPKYREDNTLEYSPDQIWPQVAGALAIVAWVFVWAIVVFGALHLLGVLRVSKEAEMVGMDQHHHDAVEEKPEDQEA